jgi:heptosyltransferase-2
MLNVELRIIPSAFAWFIPSFNIQHSTFNIQHLNILVRVPNWLGDCVMSLPFFDTLSICFPQSQVDLLAKDSIQDIFRDHPVVRTIHPFSKAQVKGLWGLFQYGKALQKQHGPYEVFITLPPSFSSALIGYGVGSPIRLGFKAEGRRCLLTHSVPKRRGIHLVHAYRCLLKDLQGHLKNSGQVSVPPDESVNRITFPFSEEERRTSFLPKQPNWKYVVFNVNSEAQSRRLPPAKWIELGNRLLQNDSQPIKLVFTGTPGECPRVAEVIQALGPKERLLDYAGKTSVRELAMLLRDADAVVSNDSGPMHLANAVGAPMVTWIGAADPVETEPFNKGKTIVINKHLDCSPCVKNRCRFPTIRCLEQISVDEMYQSVMDVMRQT